MPFGLASQTGRGGVSPISRMTKLIGPRAEYIQRKMIEITTEELIEGK